MPASARYALVAGQRGARTVGVVDAPIGPQGRWLVAELARRAVEHAGEDATTLASLGEHTGIAAATAALDDAHRRLTRTAGYPTGPAGFAGLGEHTGIAAAIAGRHLRPRAGDGPAGPAGLAAIVVLFVTHAVAQLATGRDPSTSVTAAALVARNLLTDGSDDFALTLTLVAGGADIADALDLAPRVRTPR